VINGKKGLVSILNPEYFTLKEEIKDYNLRLYDVKEPTPRLYVASRAKNSRQRKGYRYLDQESPL
jgi:hypothetical protein